MSNNESEEAGEEARPYTTSSSCCTHQ